MRAHSVRVKVLCVLALVSLPSAVVMAQPVELNLAQQAAGSTTKISVDSGSYAVKFTGLLPSRQYILSVQHHAIPIEPIPVAAIPWFKAPVPQEAIRPASCPSLQNAAKALNDAMVESSVPALVAAVQRALDAGCSDTAVVAAAQALVARTSSSTVVTVAAGEEAVVVIQRDGFDAAHPAAQWTLTLAGPQRGQWVTTYGFTIGPDRDERFFAKPGDGGTYTVTRQSHTAGATLIPSIYFSWLSAAAERRDWSVSPTIGFGVTNDAPAMLLGLSATYNRNLGFAAGIGLLKQKRLDGKYTEGQTISENLSEDQLNQNVWRPSWIVAATVRFGSNPFAGGDKQKPAAEPPATPAAGQTPASAPGVGPTSSNTGTATLPPASGVEAGPTGLSFSTAGYRLFFTEGGDLSADSVETRNRLLGAVAGATDVFVMSHGWWNSPGSADCRYQQIVDGLRSRLPANLTATSFKPVFVGIYWPSVIFPTETGDCEPAVRTPQGAELMVQGSFEADLTSWAAAAFPTAANAAGFSANRARVVALLGKERRGEALTRAEAIELATILDRWRRTAPNADLASGDGPATELFSDTPTAMVDQWIASTATGPAEASALRKALNFTNAFTFWTMKERAGIVGSRGVFDVVRAIRDRAGSGVRIHLIGHSFGGRLLSAAIAGQRAAAPNQVDSLILLEGAFSHFAFSSKDQIAALGFPGDTGGLFEGVVTSLTTTKPAVRGRMIAVYSKQDAPNQTLYPMASKLKGSDREAVRVLRYGSIGADGFQGPPTRTIRLEGTTRDQMVSALGDGSVRLFNVDASDVVRGHSDLIHDPVFDLIWAAVLASSQAPR